MRRIGVALLAMAGVLGLVLFGLARAGTETDPLAGGRVQPTTDVLGGSVLLEPPPEGFVPWVSAEEARKAAAAFTGVPADAFEAPILALYSSADRLVDAEGRPNGPLLHQDVPVWWLEVPSEHVLGLAEVWYGADAGFDAEAALAKGTVGAGSVLVDACTGEAGHGRFGIRPAERAGELAVEVSHDLGALSFAHEHRDPACPTGHTWRPPWLTGASG